MRVVWGRAVAVQEGQGEISGALGRTDSAGRCVRREGNGDLDLDWRAVRQLRKRVGGGVGSSAACSWQRQSFGEVSIASQCRAASPEGYRGVCTADRTCANAQYV